MRSGRTSEIILMLVLLVTIAGCARRQSSAKLDRGVKDTQSPAPDNQRVQAEQPRIPHAVRGRFEPGPSDKELIFVFDVSPTPQALPTVRWLGSTPRDDARTLTVQSDQTGRYSALLAEVAVVAGGRVTIELSDKDTGGADLHGADFALNHVSGSSSQQSRDGRFVVFTKPEGVSPSQRLLIGSVEQPIEGLPRGVTDKALAAVYSVTFLPESLRADDWQLTIAVGPNDAQAVLFYLPKDGKDWKRIESAALPEQSLRIAHFAGPGTYLLAREVTP
jgi:hypothetical protein